MRPRDDQPREGLLPCQLDQREDRAPPAMIGPRPHLADTESGRGTELAVFGETEMGPLALALVLAFALHGDRGGVDGEELDGDLREI